MQHAGRSTKARSTPKSPAITPGQKSAVPPAPQSKYKTMVRASTRMQPRMTMRQEIPMPTMPDKKRPPKIKR